jgi:methionine sulfoxide reductase heme-binding subunit
VTAVGAAAAGLTIDGKLLWYFNRASGMVLLVVLTTAVLLGQVSTGRTPPAWLPRFVTAELHRNISLLAAVLLGMHVLTAVADTFVDISLTDAVLPFRSPYRPLWLGLGTVALDLMLAVVATSLLRHRLSLRVWRGVHWASYAIWPAAVLHGLGTGTDTKAPATLLVTFGCVAVVTAGGLARLAHAGRLRPQLRWAAYALVAVAPLLVAGWLRVGPLAPGWAHKAGTPPPPASQGAEK